MLTEEDGPFDLIFRLREWVGDSKFPVLSCFYCTSVWIAMPLALLAPAPLLYWLPISTAAIFINLAHDSME